MKRKIRIKKDGKQETFKSMPEAVKAHPEFNLKTLEFYPTKFGWPFTYKGWRFHKVKL